MKYKRFLIFFFLRHCSPVVSQRSRTCSLISHQGSSPLFLPQWETDRGQGRDSGHVRELRSHAQGFWEEEQRIPQLPDWAPRLPPAVCTPAHPNTLPVDWHACTCTGASQDSGHLGYFLKGNRPESSSSTAGMCCASAQAQPPEL